MAVTLNVDSAELNQIQEYQLEGVTYKIQSRWNDRSGWEISIFDEDSVAILTSLTAKPNQNLTWRYSREGGLFTGDIWVLDNFLGGDESEEIDENNFGQGRRFILMYLTKTEMEDLLLDPRDQ